MAHFAVHGTWRGVAALAALFTFTGMLVFALAGGVHPTPPGPTGQHTFPLFGGLMYVAVLAVIVLGFWSKEDVIAVLGIVGLSALVILDILLRIGVLGYNGVKVI
ncbi:MAG: hypothetical protein WDA16_03755 [Candidatus Thermoplasmatota archaeon]